MSLLRVGPPHQTLSGSIQTLTQFPPICWWVSDYVISSEIAVPNLFIFLPAVTELSLEEIWLTGNNLTQLIGEAW